MLDNAISDLESLKADVNVAREKIRAFLGEIDPSFESFSLMIGRECFDPRYSASLSRFARIIRGRWL